MTLMKIQQGKWRRSSQKIRRTKRGWCPRQLEGRILRRREGLIVLKAAESSRTLRIEKRPLHLALKKSLVTWERAVSVKC